MFYFYKNKNTNFPLLCEDINKMVLDLDENFVEITEKEYNDLIDNNNSKNHLKCLRSKREPLLKAFDIYKTNVNYGVDTEDETTHAAVLLWYGQILDLDETALDNVPECVSKYVR